MIEVFIADSTALVREGLKTVIGRMKDVHIVGEAENIQEL